MPRQMTERETQNVLVGKEQVNVIVQAPEEYAEVTNTSKGKQDKNCGGGGGGQNLFWLY